MGRCRNIQTHGIFSFKLLAKAKMIEEKDPDKINPAKDRDDQTEDDTENILNCRFLKDSCNTNEDFNDPVNNRNEKKDDLNKSRLFVKPTHKN